MTVNSNGQKDERLMVLSNKALSGNGERGETPKRHNKDIGPEKKKKKKKKGEKEKKNFFNFPQNN